MGISLSLSRAFRVPTQGRVCATMARTTAEPATGSDHGRRPYQRRAAAAQRRKGLYQGGGGDARRLIDDFRNGRAPSLRDQGKRLHGYLAGMLGRCAIATHFGALGRRGLREAAFTPTPAEAQEVADLRTAFLDAPSARARPAGPRRTGPTRTQKDDAARGEAFHSANKAV